MTYFVWSGTCRDAKSPVSDGRHLYLDVHYGLPYGRTYLPFSPFTYGASVGDRHTCAGEATVLLLDHQAHPCLACLFTQFSRKLAMGETLHDCKHGELE